MSNFYDKFQTPPQSLLQSQVPVMSLRDWFAGQALAGLASQISGVEHFTPEQRASGWVAMAAGIYEIADAMLAERTKGETK